MCRSAPPARRRASARAARRAHLAAIVAQVLSPAGVGPGLAKRPADPFLARRQLGKPQVVVVAPRVIGFAHAARRAPDRADAQPLAAPARTAYADAPASQAPFRTLTRACAPSNGA